MENKDIIVLIGRSDFIDKVDPNHLSILTSIFPCATINWACTRFKSEYNFFLDKYVYNMYKGKWLGSPKFITTILNRTHLPTLECEMYAEHRLYQSNKPYTDKTLLTAGFTHDFAMSYLIKQGYKAIILLGVADFETRDYACGMNVKSGIQWQYSDKCKINSKHIIENVFARYTKIITLNPNSMLNVTKINLETLIDSKYNYI